MRNLPSLTAQFVALFRAVGNLKPEAAGFNDEYAEILIPRYLQYTLYLPRIKLWLFPNWSPYDVFTRRIAMQVQLRSVVIDQAIREALPFDQLVILGAGLDSRGWRMNELSKVDVFEVDHPATQVWKRGKADEMGVAAAKSVTFVAVDFSKDCLMERLEKHGFNRKKKTFWIMEGVTMYLTEADVKKTLTTISDLSQGGCTIALTYLLKVHGELQRSPIVSALGEPFLSAYNIPEIEEIGLEFAHCETLQNSGIMDWRAKYCPETALPRTGIFGKDLAERVWIGNKKSI
jgi:methyltransferase (TIGR00027 family)